MDESMKKLPEWVIEKLKDMAEHSEDKESREWALQQLVNMVYAVIHKY